MNKTVNKKEASELFVTRLIERAYKGAIQAVIHNLETGPAGRGPDKRLIALHQWYQDKSIEDRQYIKSVVFEAVDSAVFGCLVLLDGLTGGYPIEGTLSDFALYLQSYKDFDAKTHDNAMEMIRINGSAADIDLHDIYRIMLQEHEYQA